MATPQRVLRPHSAAEDSIVATLPSSTANATVVAVTVTVAGQQSQVNLAPIYQLISDISSRRLLLRSEALNQLAREVVQRRGMRDQEDINVWADTLARRIIESEDR